uniref:beta-glucosidase n=1 Tax=Globisporangium ultimum (strain ATCC 200006 / CBS 805.95 / DAOM BR144) TaxID=431595 RepID=K3W7X0_GLOUD
MLSSMSLYDMVGQMTQLDISTVMNPNMTLNEDKVRRHAKLKIGSYLNAPAFLNSTNGTQARVFSVKEWRSVIAQIQEIFLEVPGGHPILYGIDSVHGAIHVKGAVIFGQQINAAATFNPQLVYEMGRIASRDTLAAGIPWLFSPILEIAQNPLWSRTFETFGEDPHLASVMADAIIRGYQDNNSSAACMKHVIGYSKTSTGHDRDAVTLSDYDLLNYFAPPFLAATKAGVMTAMENYISINGVPVVANTKILQDLLRHDMKFDGLLVTDWSEINNLHDWHRVAATQDIAVEMAIRRTPIDMSMVPYNTSFIDSVTKAVQKYPDLLQRVKDSVRRILIVKAKLGLYQNPVPGAEHVENIGQAEDKRIALQLARESIVLLKNRNNILPLQENSTVFLTGHAADNVGLLCGGWTLTWQGVSGNSMFLNGVSLKQGIMNVLNGNSSITYFNPLQPSGLLQSGELGMAKIMARAAEFTIISIGEGTYAEKPGDIEDLSLPPGQIEYVREIASTGTKIILVLAQGRPRLLDGIADIVHAVIFAMLPGELGGQALAEIMYGVVNPSGKLPITYPKHPGSISIPYNRRVTTRCESSACEMEWDFGSGLSYTSFEYSNLRLSKTNVSNAEDEHLVANFTVTNTGQHAGKETIMLFLTQLYRTNSVPEVKQLKKFSKILLQPGESRHMSFTLTREDWGFFDPQIGRGFNRVVEDGEYVIAVRPDMDCNVYTPESIQAHPLCAKFTIGSTGA